MMLFHKKEKKDSRAALRRVDGAHVKYAAERLPDGTERILGKGGAVSVTGERALILCGGKAVFSCPTGETTCAELMSGDGAVFEGKDLESGRQMCVTAYFTSPIRR